MDNQLTYIDLFSGAGGFSLGFEEEGFINIFSNDIDSSFNETYRHNFPKHNLIEKDISLLNEDEVLNLVKNKHVDVIIGGPPCQGFSMAGNIGRKFIDDPRNHLFKEFVRIVRIIKPNYFVMENVARLYTHNKGQTRNTIIEAFNNAGYKVKCKVLDSADYGVPQHRKRIFFIGTRLQKDIIFPEKTTDKYVTVGMVLNKYPKLQSGQESTIPNHIAMSHTEQMLNKMKYVIEGGSRMDIPEDIRPKSGDIRKYIRYNSDKPSICITGDMRKVFHPTQNRALTVRELAKIQSFPDDFIFKGSKISQQQQVGNSVPPKVAQAIAKTILKMDKS